MNLTLYITAILFIVTRFSILFHRTNTTNIVVSVVAIICSYETVLSICQLLRISVNSSMYFAFTGSFENPGPLGGFLSVCVSVLVAYWLFGNNKILKLVCLIVSIIAGILLPATESRAALLALSFCLMLMTLKTGKGKNFVSKHWMPILLASLTIGVALYAVKKPSADGRFFMNKISMHAMMNNGILGVGDGRFPGSYGKAQADYFNNQINPNNDFPDLTSINEHERLTAECPDKAYNDYLQIGVEYGPIAMLLFIAVILYSIVYSYNTSVLFCYGLVCFAVFACFSYPLHFMQFKLLLAVFLATCIPYGKPNKRIRIVSYTFIMSGCIFMLIFHELPNMRLNKMSEIECKRIMKKYIAGDYDYVVDNSHKVFENEISNKEFLYAYGLSLNKTGNFEKSDSILVLCTEYSCDPMIWNIMGNNSLALGRFDEAEERYKHSFYMVPNRLYPLTLLAKLYHTKGDTISFLDMSSKIEVFKPKIESFHTDRLRQEIRDIKDEYYAIN